MSKISDEVMMYHAIQFMEKSLTASGKKRIGKEGHFEKEVKRRRRRNKLARLSRRRNRRSC
ncbi:hypothetical protein DRN32_01740 [Thermococci archaeon]|nr:MAG: hypothetical protein DRN32_01740 [Thermococci archaeon]